MTKFLKQTLLVLMMGLIANPVCCCTLTEVGAGEEVQSCCHSSQPDQEEPVEDGQCRCSEEIKQASESKVLNFDAHQAVAAALSVTELNDGAGFETAGKHFDGSVSARPPDVPIYVRFETYLL